MSEDAGDSHLTEAARSEENSGAHHRATDKAAGEIRRVRLTNKLFLVGGAVILGGMFVVQAIVEEQRRKLCAAAQADLTKISVKDQTSWLEPNEVLDDLTKMHDVHVRAAVSHCRGRDAQQSLDAAYEQAAGPVIQRLKKQLEILGKTDSQNSGLTVSCY